MSNSKFLENLKRYDYSFFVLAIILFIMGAINLYSATHSTTYISNLYKTQIFYFFISLIVGVGVSFVSLKLS